MKMKFVFASYSCIYLVTWIYLINFDIFKEIKYIEKIFMLQNQYYFSKIYIKNSHILVQQIGISQKNIELKF